MEDLDNVITPQQVRISVARNAVKLLGDYNDQSQMMLDQFDYSLVRDYILTVLCINNGCRSGTLANMTLPEFENASEEDGSVVREKNHKTFTTHGPVDLCFINFVLLCEDLYCQIQESSCRCFH